MTQLYEGAVNTAMDRDAVRAARQPILYRGDGSVWMGPGDAPAATAPETEKPRVFDYMPGFNTWRTPEAAKANESGGFTFAQLRALAAQTVVSGAIYKAIDKLKKVEFTFTLTPQPGERPEDAATRAGKDPRITELRTFFESPDRDREWPEWIADAWLQILTCDNLSLYRWPFAKLDGSEDTRRPGAFAIDIVDGDHITPLIDDAGRVPRDLDTEAYVQWTKGSPRKKFTRRELMYPMCWPSAQRVYGNSPVERLWFYLNIAIRRDLSKLNWYTDGNIPAGLWPVDTEHWSAQDMSSAQSLLDAVTAGKKAKSRLLLVPGGKGAPIFPAEKTLLDPFDDWLARIACFFIGIPISALIHEQNRATAENSRDAADEEGELPRIDFTRRLLNRIVRTWWGYTDIVAQPKRDLEVDAAVQSEIDDRGVRNGTLQVDEVRERNGLRPLGLPDGFVTGTGYQTFEAALAPVDAAQPTAANPAGGNPSVSPDKLAPAAQDDTAKAEGPFDYASTQINLTGDARAAVLKLAEAIPDDALAPQGRETEPHVTVKYGIDPSVTVAEVRAAIGSDTTGSLRFGATAFFAANDYDVVIVAVESEDLQKLNAAIAAGVESISTQSSCVPHATVAYVKSGRGHEFAGNGAMIGIEAPFNAVYYSDVDGKLTKLQTVKSHVRMREIAKAEALSVDDLASVILKIVRGDDEALQLLASPFHERAVATGAKQIAQIVGVDTLIGLDDPRVTDFLLQKEVQIVSVNETTAKQVIAAITSAMDTGEAPEAIASAIAATFDLRSAQAETIARTEVGSALSGGRYLQMREEAFDQHEWLTSRDARVRESHAQIDGEVVPVGEVFSNGLEYPQDPNGDPSEVINCRCISIPKIDDAKAASSDSRADQWHAAMKDAEAIENRMQKRLARFFTSQAKRVTAALKEAGAIA